MDKTNLVWKLAHYAKFVFMSRPRHFGKSLLTGLIHRAQEKTGRQVVVIIDEYDARCSTCFTVRKHSRPCAR